MQFLPWRKLVAIALHFESDPLFCSSCSSKLLELSTKMERGSFAVLSTMVLYFSKIINLFSHVLRDKRDKRKARVFF